jgi:hypothetical protein
MVDGDLRQHFETLAERYPLSEFEKGMGDFIRMVLNSMDSPKLDKVNVINTKSSFLKAITNLYHSMKDPR